jgi:hypothetical protein
MGDGAASTLPPSAAHCRPPRGAAHLQRPAAAVEVSATGGSSDRVEQGERGASQWAALGFAHEPSTINVGRDSAGVASKFLAAGSAELYPSWCDVRRERMGPAALDAGSGARDVRTASKLAAAALLHATAWFTAAALLEGGSADARSLRGDGAALTCRPLQPGRGDGRPFSQLPHG